jgi:hypothetical protein
LMGHGVLIKRTLVLGGRNPEGNDVESTTFVCRLHNFILHKLFYVVVFKFRGQFLL